MRRVGSPSRNIIETAAKAGLQGFQSAIEAAGLMGKLRSQGPYTVFAPSDAAFARVDDEVLERWLRPESRLKLRRIMTYHLLAGRLPASEVIKSSSTLTMQGTSLTVRFTEGRVHVNNAMVTAADIECSNGVLHIIDTVVVPR